MTPLAIFVAFVLPASVLAIGWAGAILHVRTTRPEAASPPGGSQRKGRVVEEISLRAETIEVVPPR